MKTKAQLLLVVVFSLIFSIAAFAQGGGGKGGGGGGRPGGEESTTNLSYPAYFFGTAPTFGLGIGDYSLGATFGSGMSYGCLVPETIGTTTYPNTSCVTSTTSGFTADSYEACVAKCRTAEVERIYWQKNTSNKWQAGYTASGSTSLKVDYIDWGDNLEGRSWPVQVLRVETNTFSTLPAFVAGTPLASNPRVRFDLWHVFGQGTNELWGAHATSADAAVPYVYLDADSNPNWPYAVNVTPSARLNIAKLETGSTTCPATATGVTQSPFQGATNLGWFFNETSKTGYWVNAPYYTDMLYGSELNIKGSYVYGYNWNLRSQTVPSEINKAGWWRLTFYTPDNSIDFKNWVEPTPTMNTLAPPLDLSVTPGVIPGAQSMAIATTDNRPQRDRDRTRLGPSAVPTVTAEAETGLMLYVPQVDAASQLTYLDICISGGKAGGGGGGGKGPR